MTTTRSEPIHLGVNRTRSVTPGGAARAAGGGTRVNVRGPVLPWRWRTVLTDAVDLLAVAWSVPFAVLLVGTPIALTIALLLWLGRLALGAF